jgi:chorismate mutase / prephenate dehydratase
MSKEEIRAKIDAIDAKVLKLLSERGALAKKIVKFKKTPYDPGRERQILERLSVLNAGPLREEQVEAIYREIISACRALQHPVTVAFLGPRATFSHSAAVQRFGASIVEMPCPEIAGVFDAVEKDFSDYGVVPFENSTEGVISYTLDRFTESPIRICGEIYADITLNLISKQDSLSKITRLYTHAKPMEQCAGWLKQNARDKEIIQVSSTAVAAQKAAAGKNAGAIASRFAAEIYELKIVERHIEDFKDNRTRFLVIGKDAVPRTGRDKTSVLFSVRHEPGSLYRALWAFEKYDLNLSMMQARPSRKGNWEYIFFVDLEGHEDDESVQNAMRLMRKETIILKTIGSYPMAKV